MVVGDSVAIRAGQTGCQPRQGRRDDAFEPGAGIAIDPGRRWSAGRDGRETIADDLLARTAVAKTMRMTMEKIIAAVNSAFRLRRPAPSLPIAGVGLILCGLWAGPAVALTCTTTNSGTGNWNATATWSGCGGGIPGPADDAVIANFDRTYTVTADATVASVTFTGGNQDTTLRINGDVLLTITGNAVINTPTNNRRKQFDVRQDGQLSIGGNLTLNGGTGEEARLRIRDGADTVVTVAGDIVVNNTDAIVRFDGEGTLNIGGNFGNGGTLTRGDGTVVYNGAANQNVGDYRYHNLRINKTGGTANLTGNNTEVEQVLTMSQGNIVTGANTLVTQSDCDMPSVVRTSGHVVGNLQKVIPDDASTCTFEIGDAAGYMPVVMIFVNGTNGGDLTAATFTPDHPNLGTSLINPALSVNRYWRLTNSGVGLPGAGFSATFNFVAGDVDAGADTAVFEGDRYVAPNWFPLDPGARTATSTQLTGITGFGDFAVGERLPGYNPNLGRFNAFETATPAGSLHGIIRTKIAGAAVVSVDIIHLNPAKTALQAMVGPVANRTVRVELLNASNNNGPLDANNCRNTWAVIQTLAPNPVFPNGASRMTISFNEPNAWPDVRIRVSFPVGAPTQIGCSADRFAIRPASLANVSATDAGWETAGIARVLNTTAAGGPVFHKAGRPFTLRATAQNAAAATTANYAGSPVPVLSSCVGAGTACIATFGTLTPGVFAADPGPGPSGSVQSNTASYSEVGSFAMQLEDRTFADVDAADSTTGERYFTSANVNVGRFVPDHFDVAYNTPQFANPCGGAFTYIGQPFSYAVAPVMTVTARNATGGTTLNYAGALMKLSNSVGTSLNQAPYDTQNGRYARFDALSGGATPVLDPNLLPDTTADPAIGAFSNGVGSLSFAAGGGLAFTRGAPLAPFDADISLELNVIDSDGVAHGANPARFGQASAGNGIAFDNSKAQRYGRLFLQNAFGSELLPLPMPMRTQYYVDTNTGFVVNMQDGCTAIAPATVSLANATPPSPVSPPTAKAIGTQTTTAAIANSPMSGGDAGFSFSAPGAGGDGYVDVTVDLSALPWLQFDWDGNGTHDNFPLGRATFGVYQGSPRHIYLRERY